MQASLSAKSLDEDGSELEPILGAIPEINF